MRWTICLKSSSRNRRASGASRLAGASLLLAAAMAATGVPILAAAGEEPVAPAPEEAPPPETPGPAPPATPAPPPVPPSPTGTPPSKGAESLPPRPAPGKGKVVPVPAGVIAASPFPPIAVLPFENLTGHPVDLAPLHEVLREALDARGVPLLDNAPLESFLEKHRVRWTGGMSAQDAASLARETGARSVLVTTLLAEDSTYPPRFALVSRLLTADET